MMLRRVRLTAATILLVAGLLLSVGELWQGRLLVSLTPRHGIDTGDVVAAGTWLVAGFLLWPELVRLRRMDRSR